MREVGRKDLGCPFGCREAHRKEQSTQRSVQFYREHKDRKRRQNSKRRKPGSQEKEEPAPSREAGPGPWPEPLVEYVRVVVSLIEGRAVSREEILEMLVKVLRQQGMSRRRKIDHAVAWLNENPP